jgi:hypothetical protein
MVAALPILTRRILKRGNMFCWIKAALLWAFKPGEKTKLAWQTFYDGVRSKPPFSIVSGMAGYVLAFIDSVQFFYENPSNGYDCASVGELGPLGEPSLCFAGPFGDIALKHASMVGGIRLGLMVLLYVWAAFYIWRILRTAFSHAPEAAGGDIGATEDSRKEDE